VLIGGLANELHRRNLLALYRKMYGDANLHSNDEDYDER
jgi:hypothetical protein